MIKILVVEDDYELNKILVEELKRNGYSVIGAYNGNQGLSEVSNNKIDLIVSDIMMPIMDGFEFAKRVRKLNYQTPFLFMSARDDIESKQKGFDLGIDDYIVKPFEIKELILRIRAILKRANIFYSKKIEIGNFIMNEEEHSVSYLGKEINLTIKEFEILFKLLSNPRKTYTRSQLMDEFWDYDSSATSRTVDVHLAKIREKVANVKEFEIKTIHGLGYKVVINEK